ncbi:MAG: hydrogenase maturation protease [Eggerthellaceae bacterium]
MQIAVFFVGNRLMLDDGVAPAVYDFVKETYTLPKNVDLFDVGCMSLDMMNKVRDYDLLITVDAVDGTDAEPGTVFRYEPHDIARAKGERMSLHDVKLADLFDVALMLGYEAEGLCYGMQVDNMEPAEFTIGLTPKVAEKVPFLAETVIAELVRRGCEIARKDGQPLQTM